MGQDRKLNLLAVRAVDPPARLSTAASDVEKEGDGDQGAWKARKGGMSRTILREMVERCIEKGGMGEEVLRGLEGFT